MSLRRELRIAGDMLVACSDTRWIGVVYHTVLDMNREEYPSS